VIPQQKTELYSGPGTKVKQKKGTSSYGVPDKQVQGQGIALNYRSKSLPHKAKKSMGNSKGEVRRQGQSGVTKGGRGVFRLLEEEEKNAALR